MRISILLAPVCAFVNAASGDEPIPAEKAIAGFQLGDPKLRVELVASEPLVESP